MRPRARLIALALTAVSLGITPTGASSFAATRALPLRLFSVPHRAWAPIASARPTPGVLSEAQAPASAPVTAQLYFRPRARAALAELAAGVAAPRSPAYHRYLSVAEFAARFGPKTSSIAKLDRYLRNNGLKVGPLASNHLSQEIRGPAAHFEAAFRDGLRRARAPHAPGLGWVATPQLPASLAADVSFLDGFAPGLRRATNLVRFPQLLHLSEPRHGAAVAHGHVTAVAHAHVTAEQAAYDCSAMAGVGLTPAQLSAAYNLAGFYGKGDYGQGQTIGLIEYALPDLPAISAFESCVGSSLTVYYDPTASPPKQPDSEVAADVEVVAALAPKANVVVYESDQSGTGLAPWEMAVSGTAAGGLPEVISSSWGSCEPATGLAASYFQSEQALYEEAAVQGQTVLVASGDDGSEGCLEQNGSKELAVDDPAAAPGVTAIGGTASDTPTSRQYVWNSRTGQPQSCLGTGCYGDGASGGGASAIWPRPGYQPQSLPQSAACELGAQGCREVPDVSALAGDPYAQYCSASVCGDDTGWVGFGGTSLATPSWGSVVLLSEPMCNVRIGFLNPLLYTETALLTKPVTSGSNDLTGTHPGSYNASQGGGYSMATGLGYLGGASLASGALCGPGNLAPTIAAAQPPAGPTPSTTTTVAPIAPEASAAVPCSKPKTVVVLGNPVSLASGQHDGCAGYWAVSGLGQVAAFGPLLNYGSPRVRANAINNRFVGITATPDFMGYWVLAQDGQVFAFGDAQSFGDPYSLKLKVDAVAMAPTPDGQGYWVASSDGGVFAFGDAAFYGSMAGRGLRRPVVGIAAAPGGAGYWLASSDGGVFGFGTASFLGSMGKQRLGAPVVGITTGGSTTGYRMVAKDGGVFAFGSQYYGSLPIRRIAQRVVAAAPSTDGRGYYLLSSTGRVYAFGDAHYLGNVTN